MGTYGRETPAGWYPDPTDQSAQRYWDGEQWTNHTQPLVDTPPPPPPAPVPSSIPAPPANYAAAPAAPPARAPKQGMSTAAKVLIILGVLCVVLLGGCVSLIVVSADNVGDSINETISEFEESTRTSLPATAQPATSAVEAPDDGPVASDESDESDESVGSRQAPLPFDVPVDIEWNTFGDADGSVWTTTIGPPRDITEDVAAANQFNPEPPEGVVFVGFDVELSLLSADKEPLSPGFNFAWELLGGATAAAYELGTIETESFGCGVVPGSFDDFDEVFVTGTLSGTVCIPLPVDDLGHPDTQVSLHFVDDTRTVFGS